MANSKINNSKHRIQLIGFDGQSYWRLFFFEVIDQKEVYYGLVNKKTQLSFSRHGSGTINVKVGKERRVLAEFLPNLKTKPLHELDGIESLGTWCPVQNAEKLSENEYKKYVSKNCNATFLIDLRNFNGTLNVQPAIVPLNKKEQILSERKFDDECQIFVYTASNPWVVFYILNVKPKKRGESL